MKGLPDSAIVGTYKRLHRRPKASAKSRAHYQKEADFWNAIVFSVVDVLKPKRKK